MQKPSLVIMAAGMGSRFGGLKQIQPIDPEGHAIIDYSMFDARRAGFEKVVFVIKHAIEDDFKASVGRRMEKYFDVRYVYQELDRLPAGYSVPDGRTKPWGTAHAVLCAAGEVDGPFAVINSDDFYGQSAYSAIYGFLASGRGENEHAMVGYLLRNTVTENGYVSRGICRQADGFLVGLTERTHIEKRGADAAYTEDGEHYFPLSGGETVSMNMWGFGRGFFGALERGFPGFLDENLPVNPMKCEYFLPSVANAELDSGKCTVRLLSCGETWYGVTYKEDLDGIRNAVAAMKAAGRYPRMLWD
jgi:dTDP-glucose pyrophosphorylase